MNFTNGARKGVDGNYFHETTLAKLFTNHMNLYAMEFPLTFGETNFVEVPKICKIRKVYGPHIVHVARTCARTHGHPACTHKCVQCAHTCMHSAHTHAHAAFTHMHAQHAHIHTHKHMQCAHTCAAHTHTGANGHVFRPCDQLTGN